VTPMSVLHADDHSALLLMKHPNLRHVEQWLIRVEFLWARETTARGVYIRRCSSRAFQ
jgi:hypothetical protein